MLGQGELNGVPGPLGRCGWVITQRELDAQCRAVRARSLDRNKLLIGGCQKNLPRGRWHMLELNQVNWEPPIVAGLEGANLPSAIAGLRLAHTWRKSFVQRRPFVGGSPAGIDWPRFKDRMNDLTTVHG
jgi:hypothetical protein